MTTSTNNLVTNSVQDLPLATTEDEKNNENNRKSLRERLIYVKNLITVEPLLAAYIMASLVASPALIFLEFEKACRSNLNYSDEICDGVLWGDSANYTNENKAIQILISNMHSWQYPLQSVMPLILVLFIGSYSDRHKLRKPFLLLPIMGEFLAVLGCILNVFFMRSWPLEAQGIAQTVVPSFFGGQTMIVMAAFSYIADVSTLEERTLRLGIVQMVLNAIVPITQSFAADLFFKIGYYGILAISTVLFIFAIFYGVFCMKEPREPVKTGNTKSLLADVFDPKHAIETCNVLLKKSSGNNRLYICLVMLILFIYSAVQIGEGSVFYLYVQGTFHWNVADYSYFSVFNTIVHLIGTILGVPLFTKLLQWTDYIILIATFLNKMVTNIFLAFATSTTMLYIASVISIIVGISPVAIRSMATKVVSDNDLGKTQSLFGICEALAGAIAPPVYNSGIYTRTLDTFPSAYFFIGIILYVLCIVVAFWMYLNYKKNQNRVEHVNGTEKPMAMDEFQITHM